MSYTYGIINSEPSPVKYFFDEFKFILGCIQDSEIDIEMSLVLPIYGLHLMKKARFSPLDISKVFSLLKYQCGEHEMFIADAERRLKEDREAMSNDAELQEDLDDGRRVNEKFLARVKAHVAIRAGPYISALYRALKATK